MRKVFVLAVVFLVLGGAVEAFRGQVFGPDGRPMAGARVTVVGRPGTAVADEQGVFVIGDEPAPPFLLLVTRPDGVALRPVTVEAIPEGTLPVHLEALAESVTVVSGIVPDLELPPAAAATVIGRGDLTQRLPTQLTDVLDTIPGASRGGEGPSVVPGLRGLPKHRTLLLLDDGRVTAERRAGASATFLDPETVEEFEVVRGPGSVAYGSDAFGGVIRARSRMPRPGAPLQVRYAVLGGSGLTERGASAEVSGSGLGGALLAGASYRELENYRSPRGEVYDSMGTFKGFRLGYQAHTLGGTLSAGWRTDMADDVGKPAPDSREVRNIYPEERSHRFNLAFERPGPGKWARLAASLAWDSYRLLLDKDTLATPEAPRTLSRSDVDANDYAFRLEAERPLGPGRLVLGVDAYGRYDLRALNRSFAYAPSGELEEVTTEVSVDSARRDDLGVFLGLGAPLGPVEMSAGVRGDRVASSNDGGYFGDRSTSHTALSGFVAATVPVVSGLDVTVQGARGFRDALLSDRYYRGISGRGFITGNPDLEPETSRQLDVAVRYAVGNVQLAAYGYLYRIDDLIERYKTSGNYFFRNRGEAEIRGVELEASVELSRRYRLDLGAQNLRGEVLDDHSPTDDVPPRGVFVVLRRDPGPGWWWLVRAAAYARDHRPGPSEKVVPGYGAVDAGLGWRVSEAVELQLLGRNLFDHAYPGSADEAAVLAPGRSFVVSMRGVI